MGAHDAHRRSRDRSAPFLLSIDAVWEREEDTDGNVAWSREFWEAMRAHSTGDLYVNFAGLGEEGEELARAAYGDNHARLAELKARYDPLNLFRLNQNIRPGARGKVDP